MRYKYPGYFHSYREWNKQQIYPSEVEIKKRLIKVLEPTLYKYRVDMVLSAHYHAYERTCAIYNYECIGYENGGIIHITIGTGGIFLDNAPYQDVSWSMYRDQTK